MRGPQTSHDESRQSEQAHQTEGDARGFDESLLFFESDLSTVLAQSSTDAMFLCLYLNVPTLLASHWQM